VITGFCLAVQIPDRAGRIDYQRTSALQPASLQAARSKPGHYGFECVCNRTPSHQATDTAAKSQLVEHPSGRVGQQSAMVFGGIPEWRKRFHSAEADNSEMQVVLGKFVVMLCEFSDLLTTEHSAEVSHEYQDRCSLLPEPGHLDLFAVFIPEAQRADFIH
jgi:hypothetical protein